MGDIISFDTPLQFTHLSEVESYENGENASLNLEMKAEVGNLTRNVVI